MYKAQIKDLESQVQAAESVEKFEHLVSLKMKKHIVSHLLQSLTKPKRRKFSVSNQKRSAKKPRQRQNNSENRRDELMQRYLQNQKAMSVQIAFGELFDDQSRYKILAKKFEFAVKTHEDGYQSNVSFNQNNNRGQSSLTLKEISHSAETFKHQTSMSSSDVLSDTNKSDSDGQLPEKELMMLESHNDHNPEVTFNQIMGDDLDNMDSTSEHNFIFSLQSRLNQIQEY